MFCFLLLSKNKFLQAVLRSTDNNGRDKDLRVSASRMGGGRFPQERGNPKGKVSVLGRSSYFFPEPVLIHLFLVEEIWAHWGPGQPSCVLSLSLGFPGQQGPGFNPGQELEGLPLSLTAFPAAVMRPPTHEAPAHFFFKGIDLSKGPLHLLPLFPPPNRHL